MKNIVYININDVTLTKTELYPLAIRLRQEKFNIIYENVIVNHSESFVKNDGTNTDIIEELCFSY